MEYDISKQNGQKRFTWIDSLKGIAVCAVVWVHSGGGALGNIFDPLGSAGAYWVELFLIITVYLSCYSLDKRSNTDAGYWRYSLQWFLERIWRLTPLYYFALLVYLIIVPAGANIWQGTAGSSSRMLNVIIHLLYLHGFFPYYANSITWVEWYIGVMVIYLAILPILYRYIGKHRITGILLILLSTAGICILRCMNPCNDQYIWEGWVYTYSFIVHLPALLYGMWLYSLKDIRLSKVCSNMMLGVSAVLYVGFAYLSAYYADVSWIWIVRTAGFGIVFFLLILSGKVSDCVIMNNYIWQSIGRNSYAIYLFHFLLVYAGGCLISDETAVGVMRLPMLWQILKFVIIMLSCFTFSVIYEKTIGGKIYWWGRRKISGYFVSS